jgi:hypothetical protein
MQNNQFFTMFQPNMQKRRSVDGRRGHDAPAGDASATYSSGNHRSGKQAAQQLQQSGTVVKGCKLREAGGCSAGGFYFFLCSNLELDVF